MNPQHAEVSARTNGVIRIGKKGRKKFAIGDEDDPRQLPVFEVDVVVAWQRWLDIDRSMRPEEPDAQGNQPITDWRVYHQSVVEFAWDLINFGSSEKVPEQPQITVAEALDFLARLREQYDELAVFFRPRSLQERASPATSEVELRFSAEDGAEQTPN